MLLFIGFLYRPVYFVIVTHLKYHSEKQPTEFTRLPKAYMAQEKLKKKKKPTYKVTELF